MSKAVWKDKENNYFIGSYTYHYFTDSFYISIFKEDKNTDKFTWFNYDHCNSTDTNGLTKVENFETFKECFDYIDSIGGLNLSNDN